VSEPRLANLFVMRALGATRRTLALRFGLTEGDVRRLFDSYGEPARLVPRNWKMDAEDRPATDAAPPLTFAGHVHRALTKAES
jgi:hypothetical protein